MQLLKPSIALGSLVKENFIFSLLKLYLGFPASERNFLSALIRVYCYVLGIAGSH